MDGGEKKLLELGKVSVMRCRAERVDEALVRRQADRSATPGFDMLSSPTYKLSTVRAAQLKEFGDGVVGIVEGVPQQVRGTFGRRQLCEQQQHGVLDCLAAFEILFRAERRFRMLGQPRTGGGFASVPGGLSIVEGQPSGRGDQERFGIDDCRAVGGLPAKPCVLDDVLGLVRVLQDPVRDPEQPAPSTQECGLGSVKRIGLGSSVGWISHECHGAHGRGITPPIAPLNPVVDCVVDPLALIPRLPQRDVRVDQCDAGFTLREMSWACYLARTCQVGVTSLRAVRSV